MTQKIIKKWKYDENTNYEQYYGCKCIISVNYGLYDLWRAEKYLHRGTLTFISEPVGIDQESTIGLNGTPPMYSIASMLVENIYIDNSKKTQENLKVIKNILISKTSYDIYYNIKKFILPDIIEI